MNRAIRILAITVCVANPLTARAGDTPPSNIVVTPPSANDPKSGEYVYVEELPEAVVKTPPVYPEAARRAGVSGTVMVQALVGKDGLVKDTRIVHSIPLLDSAAVACVRAWKFKPALSKNEPVPVWVALPVRFGPSGASTRGTAAPQPPRARAPERGMKPLPTPRPSPTEPAPEPAESVEESSINQFNARLAGAGDSAWTQAPATIAIEFIGGAACECAHFSVEASIKPERFDNAEVIVIRDGFLDDSIRGDRHRLHMQRGTTGNWTLTSATIAWRCWQGRGHEDYSSDPCK